MRLSHYLLGIFCSASLVGCFAPTRMYVDESLKPEAKEHTATQTPSSRGEGELVFGEYRATNITVTGHGAQTSGVKVGGYGKMTTKIDQGIAFNFAAPKAKYKVECQNKGESNEGTFSKDSSKTYTCKATNADTGKQALTFNVGTQSGGSNMSFGRGPAETGKLQMEKGTPLDIRETTAYADEKGKRKGEGGSKLGYNFVKDDKVVGAVEMSSAYSFWISQKLDQETKDRLALTAAALQIHSKVAD